MALGLSLRAGTKSLILPEARSSDLLSLSTLLLLILELGIDNLARKSLS